MRVLTILLLLAGCHPGLSGFTIRAKSSPGLRATVSGPLFTQADCLATYERREATSTWASIFAGLAGSGGVVALYPAEWNNDPAHRAIPALTTLVLGTTAMGLMLWNSSLSGTFTRYCTADPSGPVP